MMHGVKISSQLDSVRDNVNEQIGCKDHVNAALTVVKAISGKESN